MKIAFTGRRPKNLVGYNESSYTQFSEQLEQILATYGDDTEFICGGAQGFDQLAAKAALNLKLRFPNIKIHLYLPFEGQEKRWLKQGFFGQDMYNFQKRNADTIRYISDIEETAPYSEIVKALFLRDEAMVNDADIVIALYPTDDWQTAKGGTSHTMQYAFDKKPLYQIKYNTNQNKLSIEGEMVLLNPNLS